MPKNTAVRNLDAGPLQADIDLFELHLIQENKSPKAILTYLSAAKWFAAEGLKVTDWAEVTKKDIQLWMKRLLAEHGDSYANNQYRVLQQYFRWWSAEEEPNPMAGMKPPKIRPHLVPGAGP